MSLDLDAEAEASDNPFGGTCTLCHFIEAQPADEQPAWDALLAGPRKARTVWRVLRNHGFLPGDAPVYNHRNKGHRR